MENQTPQSVMPQVPQQTAAPVPAVNSQTVLLKISVFRTCLCISLAIICCLGALIVLTHLFPGKSVDQFSINQSITWYAKIQFVLAFMLAPAIYGMFARVPINHLRQGQVVKGMFFIGLMIIGVLSAFVCLAVTDFSHIDCGNGCSADTPSYQLIFTAFFVSLTVTIVGPILAIIRLGRLDNTPNMIGKVVRKSIITVAAITVVIAGIIAWNKYQNAHAPLFCNGVQVKSYSGTACAQN